MKIIDWIKSFFHKKPRIDYAELTDRINKLTVDGKRMIPKIGVADSVDVILRSRPNLKSEFTDYVGLVAAVVDEISEIKKSSCPPDLFEAILRLKQVLARFNSFCAVAGLELHIPIRLIKFKGEKK